MKELSTGFSPCPNDTFIFCGLVTGRISLPAWQPKPVFLEDVETLNQWAIQGYLDITKLSFHVLGHVLDKYVLLHSGAALGRGCGPLLVAAHEIDPDRTPNLTVAVPGEFTTAAMLLRLYTPHWKNIIMLRFDEIMTAIENGRADCGVIIHESRFTYKDRGLILIRDLGMWWEEISGYPIPLGGIVAKRSLGRDLIQQIDQAIKASIKWAQEHRGACQPYIRQHAQEIDDAVIQEHIGLYVNEFSEELGAEGLEAVQFFLQKGRQSGILPNSPGQPLTIL